MDVILIHDHVTCTSKFRSPLILPQCALLVFNQKKVLHGLGSTSVVADGSLIENLSNLLRAQPSSNLCTFLVEQGQQFYFHSKVSIFQTAFEVLHMSQPHSLTNCTLANADELPIKGSEYEEPRISPEKKMENFIQCNDNACTTETIMGVVQIHNRWRDYTNVRTFYYLNKNDIHMDHPIYARAEFISLTLKKNKPSSRSSLVVPFSPMYKRNAAFFPL